TGVSLFQYFLEPDGAIADYPGLEREPAWARQELTVVPMVTNLIGGTWDRALVAGVLAASALREIHLNRLVELVITGEYRGLELDYENLDGEDREPMTALVEEL